MQIGIFLYNIVLLVLYAAVLSVSALLFLYKRSRFELYVGLLFLIFIFDNTIIYMTEFIDSFAARYDFAFMTVPAFKTVIILATAVLYLCIFNTVFERKAGSGDFAVLLVFALLLLFIPMLPNSAMKVWLYYLPIQLYTLYLGIFGCRIMKKEPEKYRDPFFAKWRQVLLCSVVFAILILLEDTVVIFNFDVYSDIMVKINNRSFSEDIMSAIYAVTALRYMKKALMANEKNLAAIREEIEKAEKETAAVIPIDIPAEMLRSFSESYHLTNREQEILELLLEDKSNQEISEALFISLGTVKSHVHNIFQKVEVSRRNQLLKKYDQFKKEYLHMEQ